LGASSAAVLNRRHSSVASPSTFILRSRSAVPTPDRFVLARFWLGAFVLDASGPIDDAYREKYRGSPYLNPMISDRARGPDGQDDAARRES
jgi:hypothetical protein